MADDRTYIRVHDGMDEHPKVEGLSDGAFRLLISLWCYCSRNLNDGLISDAAWKRRGSAKTRAELLAAGLAHQRDGHVEMHDYLKHQRSAAEVAELKRKRAEAGRRGGKAKASARASAKQELERMPSKNVPSTEAEAEAEVSTHLGGANAPLYADRCKRHGNVAAPGPCGACADVRKANAAQPLTLIRDTRRCLVHDQTYTTVCSGCRADEIASETA